MVRHRRAGKTVIKIAAQRNECAASHGPRHYVFVQAARRHRLRAEALMRTQRRVTRGMMSFPQAEGGDEHTRICVMPTPTTPFRRYARNAVLSPRAESDERSTRVDARRYRHVCRQTVFCRTAKFYAAAVHAA